MVRVILVDDQTLMRLGVASYLAASGEVQVVGEAAGMEAGLALALSTAWDVLVLDVALDDRSGFELLTRLVAASPGAKVVVLSFEASGASRTRAQRGGAAAFVSKRDPPERLLEAITTLAAGRPWRARGGVPRVDPASLHELLSRREREVFMHVARGRSTVDIAAELDLSASTVSNHVANIKDKLGVRSRGEIIAYAMRAQLVE